MGHTLNRPFSVFSLAERLGLSLAGSDIRIFEVRPLNLSRISERLSCEPLLCVSL